MIRFKQALLIGSISLLALAGCSKPEPQASDAPASPDVVLSSPAESMASTSPETTDDFQGLMGVIANTKVAVEAGDYTKAQQEFDQFEGFWSKVEDGVKEKSSDTYNAIEDAMDQLSNEMSAAQPDQANALAALKSLEENVSAAQQ
jgi:hypothetical protein